MNPRFSLIFLALILSNVLTGFSQSCDSFIGTTTNDTGGTLFAFKKTIDIVSKKGDEGVSLYGCLVDSALVLIFQTAGNGMCVDQGSPIHVEFVGGEKLKLENQYVNNCTRKSMLFFTQKLNTLELLEVFKSKPIGSIKVWGSSSFIKVNIPEAEAIKIRESIQCLSTYFDEIPPPDTTFRVSPLRYSAPVTDPADSTKIFMIVEQQPQYEGGYEAMMHFIKKTMKLPSGMKKGGIDVTVFVTFVVAKDGSLQDIKIYRGSRPDVNEEAVRIIRLMPKWRPGMQNGKPVLVRFILPIRFKS
jgi:hypothetical protein